MCHAYEKTFEDDFYITAFEPFASADTVHHLLLEACPGRPMHQGPTWWVCNVHCSMPVIIAISADVVCILLNHNVIGNKLLYWFCCCKYTKKNVRLPISKPSQTASYIAPAGNFGPVIEQMLVVGPWVNCLQKLTKSSFRPNAFLRTFIQVVHGLNIIKPFKFRNISFHAGKVRSFGDTRTVLSSDFPTQAIICLITQYLSFQIWIRSVRKIASFSTPRSSAKGNGDTLHDQVQLKWPGCEPVIQIPCYIGHWGYDIGESCAWKWAGGGGVCSKLSLENFFTSEMKYCEAIMDYRCACITKTWDLKGGNNVLIRVVVPSVTLYISWPSQLVLFMPQYVWAIWLLLIINTQ